MSSEAATRGSPAAIRAAGPLARIQGHVLRVAQDLQYEGYSKHDALNAPWLEQLAAGSRAARLIAIQAVMRCPVHIRPLVGVRTARNPKGLALFVRALLARSRVLADDQSAIEARTLLDWLVAHPSPGFEWPCWGYPYPWQDVGFFAPRDFPNRVVTSFVVHALLDGFETLGEPRYLETASKAVEFLLKAPRTLYADDRHRCVSYVPSAEVEWIVMDVPALAGAAAARRRRGPPPWRCCAPRRRRPPSPDRPPASTARRPDRRAFVFMASFFDRCRHHKRRAVRF